MYGIVYKITNLVNNKIYIGQTTEDAKTRLGRHWYKARNNKPGCTYLYASLRKHGIDKFLVETIGVAPDRDALDVLETKLIAENKATNRDIGYNITPGGRVPTISDDGKQRLRERVVGADHCIGNLMRGKKVPQEVIERRTATLKASGYVSTSKGRESTPITYNGHTYSGFQQLADELNVDCSNLKNKLRRHLPQRELQSREPIDLDALGIDPRSLIKPRRKA